MGRDVTAFGLCLYCRSAQLWGISAGGSKTALPGRQEQGLYCREKGAALINLWHLFPAHTAAPDVSTDTVVLKLGDKLSL